MAVNSPDESHETEEGTGEMMGNGRGKGSKERRGKHPGRRAEIAASRKPPRRLPSLGSTNQCSISNMSSSACSPSHALGGKFHSTQQCSTMISERFEETPQVPCGEFDFGGRCDWLSCTFHHGSNGLEPIYETEQEWREEEDDLITSFLGILPAFTEGECSGETLEWVDDAWAVCSLEDLLAYPKSSVAKLRRSIAAAHEWGLSEEALSDPASGMHVALPDS
eukprot:NODE_14248_length_1119_cov_17.285282.p1 GENE.NODE_14248_length_1119_cov_17.285282~~NODE_14248_length_1119_cov_17.285282.p1  ORF type:complete len:222 (+),score=24.89 NODE_14248_length_1119_cov_17.285282:276-941(+)